MGGAGGGFGGGGCRGGGGGAHPQQSVGARPPSSPSLPPAVTAAAAPPVQERYRSEKFVHLLAPGVVPQTHHVRGSNFCLVNVFEDRIPGRAIVISGGWVCRLCACVCKVVGVWTGGQC